MKHISLEFFQNKGREGGKKHDAQKSKATVLKTYGSDYFKKIASAKRKGK